MTDKKDRAENLFGSIGNIGDDLLSEAADFKKKPEKKAVKRTKKFFSGILIAAALVLTAAITVGIIVIANLGDNAPKNGIKLTGEAFISDAAVEVPESLSHINVTVDGANTHMLPTGGKLILTTAGECDVETLAQYVTLTPTVNMSVTKTSANTFEMIPASSGFVPGTIYRVVLGDVENPISSFAFQTQTKLSIKSMLPSDLGTDVPVGNGIEITFSDAVNYNNILDYVEIEPKIECTMETYPDGKTVAFIPTHALKKDTVYTVTVKPGIESTAGTTLESGKTIRFRTTDGKSVASPKLTLDFSDELYTVYPGAEDSVTYYIYSTKRSNGTVNVNYYAFPSTDAALEQISDRLKNGYKPFEYSNNGLELVKETSFESVTSDGGTMKIDGDLPCGVYLVEGTVTANGKTSDKTQFILQVSDLAAFTESYDSRLLVFVNRYQGGTVGNAEVTSYPFNNDIAKLMGDGNNDVITGKTSADGVYDAEIDIEKYDSLLSVVKSDGSELIFTAYLKNPYDTSNDWGLSYLYTDRETYFTTDKINVFGVILPKSGEMPEELYLQCGYTSRLIPIDYDRENGYFTASVEFEQLYTCGMTVKIVDADGTVYANKYVIITKESKPIYRAELGFDKLYYKYGETINVTLTVSFFDGTPAPGLQFTYYADRFLTQTDSGITDENGQIEFSIETGEINAYSTSPIYVNVYAELTGMETATLTLCGSARYFHSDYCYRMNNDGQNVILKLNELDTSELNSESDFYWPEFPENTYGKAADGEVTYYLRKVEYIREQVGTEYNKITKQSYPVYKSKRLESLIDKGTAKFKNGEIVLKTLDDSGLRGSYYYELTYSDGRTTYNDTVWAGRYNQNYETSNCRIRLSAEKCSVGDSVGATLTDATGGTADNVLFTLVSGGITDWKVGSEYSCTFAAEHIFSAAVYGVYFDGQTYYSHYAQLCYDVAKSATSDITLTADKTVYKPGETATVKIKTNSGNGFALLSVVDEACFAIDEQNIKAVEGFFNSYREPSLLLNQRVAFNTILPYSDDDILYITDTGKYAEEVSAEISTHVREYFADNPTFSVVKLDGNGEGVLMFTVPDNITEWRLSCVSASGIDTGDASQVKLASAVGDVICTQPFFINPSYCNYYIIGDDICVSARIYGSAANGKKVSYTANLYNEKGELIKTKSASGMASEATGFDFGDIKAIGTYSVQIEAKCGEYSDAVKFTLSVTESGVITQVTKQISADEINALNPLTYPVRLTFYSDKYSLINRVIANIGYSGENSRSDDLAARYVALTVCEKMYGADFSSEIAVIKSQITDYIINGKVRLLTYSDGEYGLAAKLLAVAPEIVPDSQRENMLNEYNNYLNYNVYSDEVELCEVLLCMASLDAPVLDTLYQVAAVAGNYPTEAKLYLAAAFAAIGDYSAASDVYKQIKAEIGVYDENYGQLKFEGRNGDMTVRYTSLALLSAARISKVDATSIVKYLLENSSSSELNTVEMAAFVKFYMPTEKIDDLKLTYSIGGVEKTVSVNMFNRVTLVLTKFELETLKIVRMDDGIKIAAAYGGSFSEMNGSSRQSNRIEISKEIEKYRIDGMYKVKLTISGTSTRCYENFEIKDCIPSGARLVTIVTDGSSNKTNDGIHTYANIYNTTGQNMCGYVSVHNHNVDWRKKDCKEYSFKITVEYVIRGAVEGNFIAEKAMIFCGCTGEYDFSESYKLKIASDKWTVRSAE